MWILVDSNISFSFWCLQFTLCDRTHIKMSKAVQSKKLVLTLHTYAERIWKCKLMWNKFLLLWGHLIKEATKQNMIHGKGGNGKNKCGQWHELVRVSGMWKSFFKRGDVEKEGGNQKQTWSVTLINWQSQICRQTPNWKGCKQAWRSYVLEAISGIVPNGDATCGERGSRELQKGG